MVAELPLCVFSPEQVVTGEVPAPTVEAAVSVKLLIDTAELQTFSVVQELFSLLVQSPHY